MSADAEQPLSLASVGIGQAIVILSQSFALLAYKRALTPLYSSVPASSYISYVTIVSSALGSVVGVPTNVATLAYGSLLAAAPYTTFYVGKYTARWRDPVFGPIVTHAVVLVPILMSGVALSQGGHVRARLDHILVKLLNISSSLLAQGCGDRIHSVVPHVVPISVTRASLEFHGAFANRPCYGDCELRPLSDTPRSNDVLLAWSVVYCARRGCLQFLGRTCLRCGEPEAQGHQKVSNQR